MLASSMRTVCIRCMHKLPPSPMVGNISGYTDINFLDRAPPPAGILRSVAHFDSILCQGWGAPEIRLRIRTPSIKS